MASVLEQLIAELQYKHNTPSGTPSTPYLYGPGGLFGVAGLERDVISTRVHPRGLASVLPARGTIDMTPLFPYISGYLDHTGSVADGVCDDPQTAGPMKNCFQTAQFGRYSYMTRELELNRLGQRTNRGEFQDLRLVNDPLLQTDRITTPNINGNPAFMREVLQRFVELGISFQNTLMQQVYVGNPANNSAGGGYREFPGLDILVGTTKVDALTGTPCPSLRSDIKNFNYTLVTDNGGYTIYRTLSYMFRYLRELAESTNLFPVRWVMTMRNSLFWEITGIWPCVYQSYLCGWNMGNNQNTNFVNAADQVAMRDAMRREKYLLIDGERVDVIVDDGIVEEDTGDSASIANTCFASDIYVLPLSIRGNIASLFWEYLDYSSAMEGATDGNVQDFFWTDGGRYLWHKKPPRNWCVQWLSKIEPRIILTVPHLAGRLLNVQYCPLQHEREPFPDDAYFVDGGVQNRSAQALYSDWNSETPG